MAICTLSESAQDQINALCKENNCFGISLNVTGGGCAGFQYDWGTVKSESDLNDADEVISTGNGNLVIGAYSALFLIGTQLDYVRSLTGAQFDIKNPNAQSSCGCGVSVNFDMDHIPQYLG